MRLAVVGDIHGQIAALRRLLERLEGHGVDRVVLLGDLVDRAPPEDSLAVVRLVARHRFRDRSGRRRRLELVLGNHELNLLNCRLARPQRFRDGSWGVPIPACRAVADGLTENEVLWLDAQPRYISVQEPGLDLLVVHGGIRHEHARVPGWLRDREKLDGLTRIGYLDEVTGEPLHPAMSRTGRHWAAEYLPGEGPFVVFGHTSWPTIRYFPNAIGVDCSKHQRLAAVVLSADARPVEFYEEHEPLGDWLTSAPTPASGAR